MELEILKIFIKTNLKIEFICPSKSLVDASSLLDKNSDSSFCLCVDYWGFNNLTMKNCYSFPLIDKFPDRLGHANWFT